MGKFHKEKISDMKHVFLIHSNITLITANQTIQFEKIEYKNIIFLTTRKFKPNTEYLKISGDVLFDSLENINYSNFWKSWENINIIDEFIKNELNSDFQFYCPHVAHPFYQIIISNKFCKNVNIIEEGAACISNSNFIKNYTFKYKIINFFFNKIGIYGKRRFFRNQSNIDFELFNKKLDPKFYFISPNGFKSVWNYNKIKLNLPNISNEESIFHDGSTLLVFEGILEQRNIEESTFFSSIEFLTKSLKTKKIYVKFHPVQNEFNINRICQILKNKVEIEIIKSSTILEYEFIKSNHLIVLGFTSSLLHYAEVFGHQTQSYILLWEKDTKFQKYRSLYDFKINNQVEI